MKKNVLFLTVLFISGSLYADEPLLPPDTYSTYSNSKNYLTISNYETNKTSCYECSEYGNIPTWEFDGWFYNTYISDDGIFCVVSNDIDLLSLNFKYNEVLLSVYKNGKMYSQIKVRDIIKNIRNLEKTESHYHWGNIYDIYSDGIIFNTVEGIKSYSFSSKKIKQISNKKLSVKWTDGEIRKCSLSLISSNNKIKRYYDFDICDGKKTVIANIGSISETKEIQEDNSVINKKTVSVNPLVLYWEINKNGELLIGEEGLEKCTKLTKIFFDEKYKVLYVFENQTLAKYRCEMIQ